jgi:Tol biopolymer transport system component
MRRAAIWITSLLLLGFVAAPSPAVGRAAPGHQASAHQASRYPSNGRILFTHCGDPSGCQIYTVNPDGSALVQVTNAGDAVQGDWSPDGERIAYVSFTSGDAAIWIVNADGSDPEQLTPDDPDSDNFWPRFTPDGEWILFTNCLGFDCDGGISAIHPDGTEMHAITPNSHDSYNLADMAPDGTRMAYMRWHVGGVKMSIYRSDADGLHEQRISPPRLEGWAPDWSPTGRRIAFASYVFWDRPAPSLYTVHPNGSGLVALTHPPYPHEDVNPAYSPNGGKVVFESNRRYDDFTADLFIVRATGGNVHRVHLPFDAFEPRWGTAPLEPASLGILTSRRALAVGGPPCSSVPELAHVMDCPNIARLR